MASTAGSLIILWAIRSQKGPSSLLCSILVRRAWRPQDEQESQPGWPLQGSRQAQSECTLRHTRDCLNELKFSRGRDPMWWRLRCVGHKECDFEVFFDIRCIESLVLSAERIFLSSFRRHAFELPATPTATNRSSRVLPLKCAHCFLGRTCFAGSRCLPTAMFTKIHIHLGSKS